MIKEIVSKKIWDSFLETTYKGFFPFFQTWEWGSVQERLGFTIFRLGFYEKEKLVGISQIIVVKAKRGNYLHFRHGPVLLSQDKVHYDSIIEYCKTLAKKYQASFLRISPLIDNTNENKELFRRLGFRDAPIHNMDAEICWVLHISIPEETILANMRKSHRYLIKKALQEQIVIEQITKVSEEIDPFLGLYKALSQKRHFVAHRGLVEELDILGKEKKAVLFVAKYEEKIIGGALIDFVDSMAIYHHGAIDDAYRNLSVSYLLQWAAIREAKKRGKKLYNFWGIAPNESKKHPWYGLTLFKTGFGGEKRIFMHAKDLPLALSYWKTYVIDMLTKMRKGY